MYKLCITLLLLFSTLSTAQDIQPIATLEASGLVSDCVKDGQYLYVATDAGIVDIIDLYTQKKVNQILFSPLIGINGEKIPVRIHSVDRMQGKTLLVTSGLSAYRNVWIHDGENLHKIIDETKHLMPKRAYFGEDAKIALGTFGSDIHLYDSSEGFSIYETHISESTMGGMVLSSDKKKMIIADESGTVRIIDTNSSTIEKTYSKEHVDNIYSVAYANETLITGGQDRRVGIYTPTSSYHIKSDFLVYAVGISPSGRWAIYSSNEKNHLQIFNTKTKTKTDTLIGHFATPTKIMFIDENKLITIGDEYTIYFWVLN